MESQVTQLYAWGGGGGGGGGGDNETQQHVIKQVCTCMHRNPQFEMTQGGP